MLRGSPGPVVQQELKEQIVSFYVPLHKINESDNQLANNSTRVRIFKINIFKNTFCLKVPTTRHHCALTHVSVMRPLQ